MLPCATRCVFNSMINQRIKLSQTPLTFSICIVAVCFGFPVCLWSVSLDLSMQVMQSDVSGSSRKRQNKKRYHKLSDSHMQLSLKMHNLFSDWPPTRNTKWLWKQVAANDNVYEVQFTRENTDHDFNSVGPTWVGFSWVDFTRRLPTTDWLFLRLRTRVSCFSVAIQWVSGDVERTLGALHGQPFIPSAAVVVVVLVVPVVIVA